MESDTEWEVEQILERGRFNNVTYYLVKWLGYSRQEATWEPITNLQHCQHAITQFESALKNINRRGRKRTKKTKMNLEKVLDNEKISKLKGKILDAQSRDGGLSSAQPIQKEIVQQINPMIELVENQKEKMILDEVELPEPQDVSENNWKAIVTKQTIKETFKKEIPVVQTSFLELYVPQLPKQQQVLKELQLPEVFNKPESLPTRVSSQCNKSHLEQSKNQMSHEKHDSYDEGSRMQSENTKSNRQDAQSNKSEVSRQIEIKYPSQLVFLLNHPRKVQCDRLLLQNQRQLIRCIQDPSSENLSKQRVVFLDLRQNPAALEQLGPIDIFKEQQVQMDVKMLGKLSFGWIAIGITQKRWALATVESIEEDCWEKFKEKFK